MIGATSEAEGWKKSFELEREARRKIKEEVERRDDQLASRPRISCTFNKQSLHVQQMEVRYLEKEP